MNATKTAKLPTLASLYSVCRAVKKTIADDYRVPDDSEDDQPGIQLTVGWSAETGEWDYQTGDNSYSGGAYFYPHWAVVGVYRSSSCMDLARDIQSQLADLASY